MRNSFVIAKNTFKQALRDKILYGILIFSFLFIGSTVALSSLSLGEDAFIIRSFGLAGIYIFSLIITIFLAASTVYEEVEKKTTYFLLSKPVNRADVVVGKFMGLLAAICMTTLLMFAAYLGIVYLTLGILDYMAFWSILLQLMETGLLIGILILLSIFTTPLASIIYTILILYIGHLLDLIRAYALKAGGFTKYILITAYYIFPNLEKFNIRDLIIHKIPVPPKEIILSTGYAVVYIFLVLYLAQKLLNRKEL